MPRGANAQLAVDMFDALQGRFGWRAEEAWQGIAMLLLTCDVQVGREWRPFHQSIVFRESNDYKILAGGPNATMRKAEQLTTYLAERLEVPRTELCGAIGHYWRHPNIKLLQQHNLVGNAFRSLVTRILETFGGPGLTYVEEQSARELFAGFQLVTRSKDPNIDIVAFRNDRPVALLSTRWRYRHDRVDVTDEALAYSTPAHRAWAGIPYYAVLGEFSAARLEKVLAHTAPAQPHGPIRAAVHFQPDLLRHGLGENGRVAALKSLSWLCEQSQNW